MKLLIPLVVTILIGNTLESITQPYGSYPPVESLAPSQNLSRNARQNNLWVNYRLPKTIQPLHYVITLTPYIDEDTSNTGTYDGETIITIQPRVATDRITLHASNERLNISFVKIQSEHSEVAITNTSRDSVTDFLILSTSSPLKANTVYNLTIVFTGDLHSKALRGFYSSFYIENETKKWMASTQFEPTSAREAFPCFDEPALKATFDMNIVHLKKYTALSNMRQKGSSTPVGADRVLSRFETTPKISTYLIAFAVSEYLAVTNQYKNQTLYCPESFVSFANRSIHVAESTVRVIGSMLGIEYHLDKLDHIPIPSFAAGAMENWGLITYQFPALLFNPEENGSAQKESIYTVIIHEIAHQWFGDVVSPLWWKYTWLNEGFATYFMHFATNEVVENLHPEFVEKDWRMDEVFASSIRQRSAFYNDFFMDMPMTRNVESPNEVMGTFDKFSYNKGGAVLVMLEHILTTPIFRQGLHYYLNDRAYGNAEPDDLWRNLQMAYDEKSREKEVSYLGSQTVADIGNSWTLQGRVPVVMVSKVGQVVTFNQSKYMMKGDPEATQRANWIIPINYALESRPDFSQTSASFFLTEKPLSININSTLEDWIIVNNQQTGYYRVNYDIGNWRKLINATRDPSVRKLMPKVTLAQLIDDSLDLCKSGHLSYTEIGMELFQFLADETDYIPWLSAINQFIYFDGQLASTPINKNYQENQLELVNKTYFAVNGFNSSPLDGHALRMHRVQIVNRACWLGHQVCRKDAEERLNWAMEKLSNRIEPDLILPVYCGGLWNRNQTLYDLMMERLKISNSSLEKSTIKQAVNCFGEPEAIEKWLDEILGDRQEGTYNDSIDNIIRVVESGRIAMNVTFNYLSKRIDSIYRNHGNRFLESLLERLAPHLVTRFHETTVRIWREYFTKIGVETDLMVTLETTQAIIKHNIAWTKENIDAIKLWLAKNNHPEIDVATKF